MIKKILMLKKVFVLFVFGLVISCQNSSEKVMMNAINGEWKIKDRQDFTFDINEASSPKNIIFVLRNNNEYPYSNIRFIVNFTDEKGKNRNVDTVNYILAKPNGEWIGSGFGETKENLFQYKLNYKFPKDGKYKIGITQAMRLDKLPGIEDVGIKIEQAKP
jgi:gliding motility-associated lipoprotein GldH